MENFKGEKVDISSVITVWIFVSLQNLYIEILIPKVRVIGGGDLGGDQVIRTETSWLAFVAV